MEHSAVPPDADVHMLLCVVWHHVDINEYAQGHVGHFYDMVEERDAPVGVDHAFFPQAEHILRGPKGGFAATASAAVKGILVDGWNPFRI